MLRVQMRTSSFFRAHQAYCLFFFPPFFCLRVVKQSEWTAPEAVSLSSPPWFMNCKRFQGFKTCPPGKKTVYLTFYRGTLNVLPLLVLDHTFEVQGTLSIHLPKKKKVHAYFRRVIFMIIVSLDVALRVHIINKAFGLSSNCSCHSCHRPWFF